MSTTTIIILNAFFMGAIALTITGMLFYAIRTSPDNKRRLRRPARVRSRTRAAAPIRVPATVRD